MTRRVSFIRGFRSFGSLRIAPCSGALLTIQLAVDLLAVEASPASLVTAVGACLHPGVSARVTVVVPAALAVSAIPARVTISHLTRIAGHIAAELRLQHTCTAIAD